MASTLTVTGLVAGFLSAKLYYLAENVGSPTAMDLGAMGFTWYGGFLGGALAMAIVAHRKGLPLRLLAGSIPVPRHSPTVSGAWAACSLATVLTAHHPRCRGR